MLIKFQSEGAAPFEMLQDHACHLISLMGLGGQTEGAISGSALDDAINKLRTALQQGAAPEESVDGEDDDDDEPVVSISARALPLVEMLHHAKNNNTYVMWKPS